MHRCLHLAALANGWVAPNPMVGAVLVHNEKIIGEGYHMQYGGPHAEVNCIRSVMEKDRHLIREATLYVSLEPCAHYGKTPPCADLVIKEGIQHVVIGVRDPFVQVNGKGIEKLLEAGIKVETGILENACRELNKRFFLFNTEHRPYILLKWAQTADGKIANEDLSRVMISNAHTNRMVHKWRGEEMSILVGTNTAVFDDPELNTRLWPGANPVRLVIDMDLRLPSTLRLFNGKTKTIVFNRLRHQEQEDLLYYQVTADVSLVHQVVHALYQMKLQSVLVEGGARLLQQFIDEGMWDEARVICNEHLSIGPGLKAPEIKDHRLAATENILTDRIQYYQRIQNNKS
jgi:diaminohydroxyphosphoribosylaminopyrimidine deaminase/5-amino-6-(5-phosphoribosylamino)uracil reductase